MGTLQEKLNYLEESKRLITEALKAKGVLLPPGTPFRDYPKYIGLISGEGDSGGSGGSPILPPSSSNVLGLQVNATVSHKVKAPYKYGITIDSNVVMRGVSQEVQVTYHFKDPYMFNVTVDLCTMQLNNLKVTGGI